MKISIPSALLAVFLGACSAARPVASASADDRSLEPGTLGSVARLTTFGDLSLASQPSPADLLQAKADGVKLVIDLRPASEHPDFDERTFVSGLGLEYVNLPISNASSLKDETFTHVRELLNSDKGPILVHCASANRVGAVWIPWRVLDGGLSIDQAVAEAKTIGLKSQELEYKARDYVTKQGRPK